MKSLLVTVMLIACVSKALCIKCYVGDGDMGGTAVKETDGFVVCSKITTDIGGLKVVQRKGLESETAAAVSGCQNLDVLGTKTETCFCNTDLCNAAPATAQALMPIIAMVLLVKLFA